MPHQVERDHLASLVRPILESGDGEGLIEQFDSYICSSATSTSAWDFRELVFELVVDFLDSDGTQTVRNAARIIRRNKGVYGTSSNLDTIVETLADITRGRKITTASEAALTTGFLLNTRPQEWELPSWDGSYPSSQQGMKDLDQQPYLVPEVPEGLGYIDKVADDIVDDAIDALIKNIDRKDYKRSTNWDVGKACTLSIGFIGYQSPERVKGAVPALLDATTQNDTDTRAILYALTCIGYSRPNLLGGDVISWIEELADNASGNVPRNIQIQAEVGRRKIGHGPTWLGRIGTYPGPDLEPIFEKLFRFMLGSSLSYPVEVSDAVVDIVEARPNDAIPILSKELRKVVNGNSKTINFPSNLMNVLRDVSESHPSQMQPIAIQAIDIYSMQGMERYWYEQASLLFQNIYQTTPSNIPSGLDSTLQNFLQDEKRGSVRTSIQELLDTIT